MITHKEVKKILAKQYSLKKNKYKKEEIAFSIANMIFEARLDRGLTQKDLAEKLNTKQTSIARLESGHYLPSMEFLYKVAQALNADIIAPKFKLK